MRSCMCVSLHESDDTRYTYTRHSTASAVWDMALSHLDLHKIMGRRWDLTAWMLMHSAPSNCLHPGIYIQHIDAAPKYFQF